MWGNRWGSLTGVRIDKENFSKEDIKKTLRKNLQAEDAGLVLRNLRTDAQKAVESPVDFGQLFMGFGFCNYGCIGNNWDALWFFARTKKSANRGIESSWLEDNKIKIDLLGEGL